MNPGTVFQLASPALSFVADLGVGALAGFVAALALALPVRRRSSQTFAPAYVAASVLRRKKPDEIGLRDASVAHHGAGALAGALYGVAFSAFSVLVPGLGRVDGVAGVAVLPHLLAVAVAVLSGYAAFAYLVLPRAGSAIYEEQSTAVRGQWLRTSLVFGATLTVVAPFVWSSAA
ncbi:hypothetical protein [Halegenticoccus tardaugens]|uniref:hypothetical protein n=1 Tax=Halegenticoccus tardaugens TaxID=2071624 RepID=UPI00100BF64C|nr:hypothetical protein [Halegenticoccus tardaugens]